MSEPLIVGEEVLDYSVRLCAVAERLGSALELAEGISAAFASGCYEGEALGEMELFINSLISHISRLMQFYMKGGQYASGAFLAMMESDRMMSQVMMNWLEKNQEVWDEWAYQN